MKATCNGDIVKVEKMINEDGININSAIWVSIHKILMLILSKAWLSQSYCI